MKTALTDDCRSRHESALREPGAAAQPTVVTARPIGLTDHEINWGATALRDKILDETLNKHAERYDVDAEHDALAFEAAGAPNASCDVAVKLGAAYRSAHLTGFNLKDWYQACGLDDNGELYDGLFDDEAA